MTAKRKPKVPEGYKDEGEFITEALERFQQAVDFDRENRDAGREDLEFLAGEQWDKEALDARDGLPCLTLNTLPPFVAQVVGDIRINKPAIKVRPAEDADKDLAEVREGLIRAIERDNDAPGVYSNTGENQVACGIGNFRIFLKEGSDTSFDRDIAIEAIPDAFAVVWDPLSTERTGRDAEYCFVQSEVPRKAFEARFKDQVAGGLEIPQNTANGWFTTDTVRVTEYWIAKTTKVDIALLEGGQVVELAQVPEGVIPLKTRTAQRKSACVYLINGTAILEGPNEIPIDRLPIIRARGWEVTVGTKRIRWGLVRFAKDAARLKNYWRSVSAQKLALAPRQQWLIHESQAGSNDDFRTAATNGDTVLVWNGQVEPKRMEPPQIEAALLHEAQLNSQDIKDVTGIHDASLGAQSNETSGKAILARERQGDVATYIYHDNLQAAIREGGRIINQLIPVVYDTARSIRVIGEDESVKIQRVNDPMDPNTIDLARGRYDVVVETGPSYSTRRQEAAESMEAFFQVVPAAAQLAGDLYAQAQDWPMGDQFAKRMKKALPPGVADDDEDDQSPEAQAKRQAEMMAAQEQQAIQKAAVGLQMAEQEAKVAQAQADASKAQAEAGMAQIQLGMQRGEVARLAAQMAAETLFGQLNQNQFGQGMAPPPEQAAMGQGFPGA
jgi:hypothetical protein